MELVIGRQAVIDRVAAAERYGGDDAGLALIATERAEFAIDDITKGDVVYLVWRVEPAPFEADDGAPFRSIDSPSPAQPTGRPGRVEPGNTRLQQAPVHKASTPFDAAVAHVLPGLPFLFVVLSRAGADVLHDPRVVCRAACLLNADFALRGANPRWAGIQAFKDWDREREIHEGGTRAVQPLSESLTIGQHVVANRHPLFCQCRLGMGVDFPLNPRFLLKNCVNEIIHRRTSFWRQIAILLIPAAHGDSLGV